MRMEENHGMAMEEVMRGCEFANQLQQLLLNNNRNDLSLTATTSCVQYLVKNIINSFNNVLFLLDKHDFSTISPVVKSVVDFEESCKSTSATRGCYKRRKTTETLEKVTETLTDDGHQWRKYGQKKINNSQYSRCYFRCSHKYDQRCLTTKQVDRIQQKPPLYKTTYYGHHTCGNLSNPNIIHDPNDTNSSILLSFNNTFPIPTEQECPFLSSHDLVNKDMLSPDTTLDDNSLSRSHVRTLSSTLESGHKNMTQYGFLYDFVEFDDDLFLPFDGI